MFPRSGRSWPLICHCTLHTCSLSTTPRSRQLLHMPPATHQAMPTPANASQVIATAMPLTTSQMPASNTPCHRPRPQATHHAVASATACMPLTKRCPRQPCYASVRKCHALQHSAIACQQLTTQLPARKCHIATHQAMPTPVTASPVTRTCRASNTPSKAHTSHCLASNLAIAAAITPSNALTSQSLKPRSRLWLPILSTSTNPSIKRRTHLEPRLVASLPQDAKLALAACP